MGVCHWQSVYAAAVPGGGCLALTEHCPQGFEGIVDLILCLGVMRLTPCFFESGAIFFILLHHCCKGIIVFSA